MYVHTIASSHHQKHKLGMDSISISDAHAKCVVSFTKLIAAIENPVRDFRDQAPLALEDVLEEYDRYVLWTENVGASYSGKRYAISLDYRLREASFYKVQVRYEPRALYCRYGTKFLSLSKVLKLLETLGKFVRKPISLRTNWKSQGRDTILSHVSSSNFAR
jgi:hypothetical protein